jgi:hypothetical protein
MARNDLHVMCSFSTTWRSLKKQAHSEFRMDIKAFSRYDFQLNTAQKVILFYA